MTRKELAQQALDILKDENEQLYNTLSWYIGCLEKENTKLKKAIEIFKKTIVVFKQYDYLMSFKDHFEEYEITKEQYDLLSEVLEND